MRWRYVPAGGVCAVTSWETRSAQLQFAMKTHAETVREHELARIALDAAEAVADMAWKNERAASSAVNALVDTMRQECAEEVL